MTLQQLAEEYGYADIMDAIEAEGWAIDSVIPGLCRTKGCDGLNDCVEPDARNYFCENCGQSTIDSVLVRLGVI